MEVERKKDLTKAATASLCTSISAFGRIGLIQLRI
jgi:hypothetical protein